MVSTIENQYTPDYVSPPGETLQETLESLGMTQAELAERTGRPTKTISEIVKGKAAITPETALQLERVLSVPASFWTNRETNYREWIARRDEQAQLREQIQWLERLPLAAMIRMGWVRRFQDKTSQLREVLGFFGVATPTAWNEIWCGAQAEFRKSRAFESDPGAVAAWLRKGETQAQTIRCQPFAQAAFSEALRYARTLTVETPEIFVPRLTEALAQAGVALTFVPELPKARVCGATRWLSPNKALVQLSLRYRTNDHLWFTFFHEAAHILKHGKRDVFIESSRDDGAKESEADQYASDFLIPKAHYQAFIRIGTLSESGIRAFAGELGIAPGIVVGRLQHDKLIARNRFNHLKQSYDWRIS